MVGWPAGRCKEGGREERKRECRGTGGIGRDVEVDGEERKGGHGWMKGIGGRWRGNYKKNNAIHLKGE